jgi:hypothetical protein
MRYRTYVYMRLKSLLAERQKSTLKKVVAPQILNQCSKTFLSVIYKLLFKLLFVPGKLFQPCLMFAGKPLQWSTRCFTEVCSVLTRKH